MSETELIMPLMADASPDRPPAGAPPRTEMARKAELEAALQAAPRDAALRTAYFEHLARLAASHTGLLYALLPELEAPLYFRCGTPDVTVMAHIFRDEPLAVPMQATPLRILLIGAYAGYTAVDLARRHPRALVLAAEPQPDNFRLLALNTGAWRRIRVANTALWHSPTRLAALGRFQAEWSVRLTDEALDNERMIPAMPVAELLGRGGFTHADMIVCDASGAEREIFADPMAPWLRHVDVAMVRVHESIAPGAGGIVAACFPEPAFERQQHREMEVFLRRTPRTALPPGPPDVSVVRSEPGLRAFRLQNVAPYGFAFFVFDGTSCQLHPNPPGAPPPRAVFPVDLDGHRRLVSRVAHEGRPPALPVRFTIAVEREDGSVLARDEATVAPRHSEEITLALPEGVRGTGRVVLETEMAPGAAHNQMAWARFIDPRLF
jgi:FkbM family methyltransferase